MFVYVKSARGIGELRARIRGLLPRMCQRRLAPCGRLQPNSRWLERNAAARTGAHPLGGLSCASILRVDSREDCEETRDQVETSLVRYTLYNLIPPTLNGRAAAGGEILGIRPAARACLRASSPVRLGLGLACACPWPPPARSCACVRIILYIRKKRERERAGARQ